MSSMQASLRLSLQHWRLSASYPRRLDGVDVNASTQEVLAYQLQPLDAILHQSKGEKGIQIISLQIVPTSSN
jgi:hypothetical protein